MTPHFILPVREASPKKMFFRNIPKSVLPLLIHYRIFFVPFRRKSRFLRPKAIPNLGIPLPYLGIIPIFGRIPRGGCQILLSGFFPAKLAPLYPFNEKSFAKKSSAELGSNPHPPPHRALELGGRRTISFLTLFSVSLDRNSICCTGMNN